MLAATWGRTIDPKWQGLWAKAGAAGLVAAVVLERMDRKRALRNAKIHKEAAREVSENRLARWNEQESTCSSVIDAIHELSAFAGADLLNYPLSIIPVEENDEPFEIESARSIRGALATISPTSISFTHQEPFETQIVLLQFKLHKRRTLCFVVEAGGTVSSDSVFTTTGAVLATGQPSTARSASQSRPRTAARLIHQNGGNGRWYLHRSA